MHRYARVVFVVESPEKRWPITAQITVYRTAPEFIRRETRGQADPGNLCAMPEHRWSAIAMQVLSTRRRNSAAPSEQKEMGTQQGRRLSKNYRIPLR
jgi:hypothetical protein